MTKQTQFFPLSGGLDIITAAIAARPGTARAALNYESDATGYRRLGGYERFDGQLSPTDAYDAESNEIAGAVAREAARDAIQKPTGEGPIRGVWFYNDNVYCVRDQTPPANILVNGDGSSLVGWTVDPVYSTATLVGGRIRLEGDGVGAGSMWQQITTIPGVEYIFTGNRYADSGASGAIGLGTTQGGSEIAYFGIGGAPSSDSFTFTATTTSIWVTLGSHYDPLLYAEFDNLVLAPQDPISASMFRATGSGWASVFADFPPGGHYEFVNYNFTGATSNVKMYGVNGVGKAFQFDGTTVTFITTGMPVDKPFKIEAHKRHLFLAFPGGSLQHSAIGDPLTWTAITGALELALGDEITNLVSAAPANLVVTAKNSVSLLYGSDASDWQLETITNEAGALPFTAEKMGNVIYMDNRGLRSMATTPSFGNFNIGTMTMLISPLLRAKLAAGQTPVASCRVRGKDAYRVFFDDGYGLSVYVGRKNAEIMPIDLGVPITCLCSAETENNVEKIWFGDANGWVYQMDKGRSFDGEPLTFHLRLPFNHMGGPQILKRWHKAIVEYDSPSMINLKVTGEIDYADPAEPALIEQNIPASGGGGFWDTVNWDQFFWSAPVEGSIEVWIDAIGDSMSLLLGGEASDEEPHILQGITLVFSVRGVKR